MWTQLLVAIVLPTAAGCGGAATAGGSGERPEGPSVHREAREEPFSFREAASLPGGYRLVERTGTLSTLEVLPDGTARMRVTFSDVVVSMNGRRAESTPPPAEIRFMSGRSGGVSGAMSVIGAARTGETFMASVLPLAWPPTAEWPPATTRPATVAVNIGGAEAALDYRRHLGAPAGVDWISLAGDVPVTRSPSGAGRARLGAVVASAGHLAAAARLALGSPSDPQAGVEVEMRVGEGVALPELEPGSLLACADDVRTLRARLDEAPAPPFVLNRPIEDALLTDDALEAVGEGILLDLRDTDAGSPLDALFAGIDESLPPVSVATLRQRLDERLASIERATQLTAALTGLGVTGRVDAPIYLLFDASASAKRVMALGRALGQSGREARVVVRRPTTGPREGMLRGSLWPIAERLLERATDCPLVRGAVAELAIRDVVASPSWVRAVVAGGVGTCGCNAVMADELAREVLRWSAVELQSWGYAVLVEPRDPSDTVGEVYGGR